MSRSKEKIRKAIEAKGWTILELDWEPIGPAMEKCGPDGGWSIMIEKEVPDKPYEFEHLMGYNIGEIMDQIAKLKSV